jgi:hypothetical protein
MQVSCQAQAQVFGHARESVPVTASGFIWAHACLSAFVPALRRTGHLFVVSGSEERSQKIEFVFSASPETIRREPREHKLLYSVGNRQNLAVCASMILFSFIGQFFRPPGSCAVLQG